MQHPGRTSEDDMDPVRGSGRRQVRAAGVPARRGSQAAAGDSGIPVGYGALVVVYPILAVVVVAMLRRPARVPLLPQMAGPGQRAA